MNRRFRIAGINFEHFHMGDLLREVAEHPQAELVGICDEQTERMDFTKRELRVPDDRVFTDYRECMEKTKPDLVILCPAAASHGKWTKQVAEYGVHILIEKPFAGSLAEADEMAEVVGKTGKLLAINWPSRWMPGVVTARSFVDQGMIGEVIEVHHYGGNRGPLYHGAGKLERAPTMEEKASSWFYQPAAGGGSLLDYMGYGATLGTWFLNGRKPIEVTCMSHQPAGLEVDEHAVAVARYEFGLSKFETRWGTFTDPWTYQPQPKCGFVLVGREGTISIWDYATALRVQTKDDPEGSEHPVQVVTPPMENAVQYMLHCIETETPVTGPLSVEISRTGQQIVDTAALSAREKRTLALLG